MTNDEKVSKVKEILEQVNNMPENDSDQMMNNMVDIQYYILWLPQIELTLCANFYPMTKQPNILIHGQIPAKHHMILQSKMDNRKCAQP